MGADTGRVWTGVAARYVSGESSTTIAASLGTTANQVLRYLRSQGVEIRSKGGTLRKYDEGWSTEFVRRYQAGGTIVEIARALGVGQGTVWRGLRSSKVVGRQHGLRKKTIHIPNDVAALAYFAGLFDGEGNLQLRPRTGRGAVSVATKMAVYNTNAEVMAWTLATFGGHLRWDTKRVERYGGLPLGIWEIYRARDVDAMLQAVLPYLIVKRAAAETALAIFAEHLSRGSTAA